MDAFYASVEQRDKPELKGKPVIVGGRPEQRGVVAACSYEARSFGVHSAMPSSRALKLCPEAVFLRPRFDAYREASSQIHAVFREFTHIIEPLSLDEAYLDVTELAQHARSATDIAKEIKRLIKERTLLTASAGVSYNKFLAKLASDMDKPDGLTVIRPEQAQAIIDDLAVRKFHGIGKATEKRMHKLGIFTGADLKQLSKIELQTEFGQAGGYYFNIARGQDQRQVKAHRKRKSIGNETTFANDLRDKRQIWQTLEQLSAKVASVLQSKSLQARTITLKVRYANFEVITRSHTPDEVITNQQQMLALLPPLLRKTEVGKVPIRLIGVTLANLQTLDTDQQQVKESTQLGLFSEQSSASTHRTKNNND